MIILGGAHLLGQFLLDVGYIYIYTLRTREVVPRDGPPLVDEAKSIEESIRFFLSIAFETLINLGAHL